MRYSKSPDRGSVPVNFKGPHKEDAGDSDCYVTPVVTSSHITTESNGTYNEEEKRDVK
jgi:hypothetical protein